MLSPVQMWLLGSNLLVCVGWLRVLAVCALSPSDISVIHSVVTQAVFISSLECLNAILKLTRSKWYLTMLFTVARAAIALVVIPKLLDEILDEASNLSIQQTDANANGALSASLFTSLCWASGESVRFSMFAFDQLETNFFWTTPKTIRYNAGT